jgi:predicted ATPase
MPVKFSVNNFGPIRTGSAELNRLNVLIGPNNSGKSVLATLIYAALSANPMNRAALARLYRSPIRYGLGSREPTLFNLYPEEEFDLQELAKDGKVLYNKIADGMPITPSDVPSRLSTYINNAAEASLSGYADALIGELERCFGSKLQDLIRIQAGRRTQASISISHGSPNWTIDVAISRAGPDVKISRSIDVVELLPKSLTDLDRVTRDRLSAARSRSLAAGLDTLLRLALNKLFREFPHSTYYLPAARSGILQSQRALASFVVERAPLAGIEDMGIPRISGVVSDFIGQLLTLESRRRRKSFEDTATALEQSVLAGQIEMEVGPSNYPEISYRSQKTSWPLHRTSSMISEMAPVVLYLRYLLSPVDMLIIEEPESHLHPQSQIALARAVVELVESGLQIMLTTHSDFFLQQLSNSILAFQATASAAESAVMEMPPIAAEKVSAYLFIPQPRNRGTVMQRLEVSPRGGIPDIDFVRVAEEQYDETVKLDRLTR